MGFLIFLIFGIVAIVFFYQRYIGSERWCENCNQWFNMKLKGEWFICESCGWKNISNRGCPHCGWYGKYENRFLRRIGPVVENQYCQSLVYYREWWSCPKHGEYEVREPVIGNQYQNRLLDPYYEEEMWDYYPDSNQGFGPESEDHWGPV